MASNDSTATEIGITFDSADPARQAQFWTVALSYVLGTPTATDRRKRNGDTAQIDQDRWSLEVDTAPVEWQRRQWTR